MHSIARKSVFVLHKYYTNQKFKNLFSIIRKMSDSTQVSNGDSKIIDVCIIGSGPGKLII